MAHTTVNIRDGVSDDLTNMETNVLETTISEVNDNYRRSNVPVSDMLLKAAENGGVNFSIFILSSDSKSLPKRDPRATQMELQKQVSLSGKITNVRNTRSGSLIVHTSDVACAIEVANISEFMGMAVNIRVVWENITNRFLLFNIPVDIPLSEIAFEIQNVNNLNVLEIRRFVKKNNEKDISPVLITTLGTRIPQEIKLWYNVQKISQFIDRPRQCNKCFKFNHPISKCTETLKCVNCGMSHDGPCTSAVSCTLCEGKHRADYNLCPARLKEAEFLRFKCLNHLSFVDARRRFFNKARTEPQTYATSAKESTVTIEATVKKFEQRTDVMIKLIRDWMLEVSTDIKNTFYPINETIKDLVALISDKFPESTKRRKNHKTPDKGGTDA